MDVEGSANDHGYISDFSMFQGMHWFHRRMVRKSEEERTLEDNGPFAEKYPYQWATLVGKGYLGGQKFKRCIHPTKKTKNCILTPAKVVEIRHNIQRPSNGQELFLENMFYLKRYQIKI